MSPSPRRASGDNSASSQSSHTLTEVLTNCSQTRRKRPNVLQLVFSHSLINQDVLDYDYNGAGTEDDPFVVEFIPDDPRDPMNFSPILKWTITVLVAFATLAVAFASSAYSGGIEEIVRDLHHSEEVVILGISLFVVGVSIAQ